MHPMSPHSMLGSDRDAVKGAKLEGHLVRRVWGLVRHYRRMLAGYLTTIVLEALLGIVPALLIKRIVDDAIPNHDRGLLTSLALVMVAIAFAEAVMSLAEGWWSARIGEGLIFDLRSSLFDHTQRMPIAFFTRTQTGALISRMNNDVIGAQRAVTGTLGSVVSNVVTLVVILAVMGLLEWRITLVRAVLLPLFLMPAKRIGWHLQTITRESMNLNAEMNTTMTERFNVAGALLVKLFGSHDDEASSFSNRAGRVRDIGVRSAMYGRVFFIALTLVGAIGTVAVYYIGGQLVISGTVSLGTMIALATYVAQIYGPLTALTNARVDVMTALVSFERVFEVLDTPSAIIDRPGAVDLVEPRGRIEFDDVWFRYPSAAEVSSASLEADPQSGRPLSSAAGAFVLRGVDAAIEPGELVALVGPSGGGKTTISNLIPRLYDVTSGSVCI